MNPQCPTNLLEWVEAPVPPKTDPEAREAWFDAANCAVEQEWYVYSKGGQPHARLCSERRDPPSIERIAGMIRRAFPISEKSRERPSFTPTLGAFGPASAFARVDDGWLVGFDNGEFGGILFWYSRDGENNYVISDHQVVDFFSRLDGMYAIEGLSHLCISRGSIIRITRPSTGAHWQASVVVELPASPDAVSLRRDGTILLTLSNALVSLDTDLQMHTLLPDAPWAELYPSSSVLSADEQKLYIGMRQVVGEFELTTHELRFLVPSKDL